MSVLQVKSLCKSFGANKAVDNINIEIAAGQVVALIGPNGAGKTTTFNLINGQLQADSGQVYINKTLLHQTSPTKIARLGVGRTFQIAEVFSSLTVIENVQMALMAHHNQIFNLLAKASRLHSIKAMTLLKQVNMQAQAYKPCNQLAYGDVKRLELAMALASNPKLLLMDEPTAGMAPAERISLMELVCKLAKDNHMAILFTEHSMDVVFGFAQHIIVMAQGSIVAQGIPETIQNNEQVKQIYFGGGNSAGLRTNICINESLHRPKTMHEAKSDIKPESLLDVQGLNSFYGAAQVLFNLNLNIKQGEVVALIGLNGAGKSTTLKSIMGMLNNTQGEISFLQQKISKLPTHKIAKMGLGYVPEDRRIFSDLTVLENLKCGRQEKRFWHNGDAAPYWSIRELFEYFPNLAKMIDRYGDEMSGGEQQMLSVARTLMGNPFLVLLDEPSEGVAPIIVHAMVDMIKIIKSNGVSVILAEQNTEFAAQVADRAYVLEKGQITFSGSMSEAISAINGDGLQRPANK